MTETRKCRIARNVRENRRKYTITVSAAMVGTVIVVFGDLILGIIGNLVASIVGPVFGIH